MNKKYFPIIIISIFMIGIISAYFPYHILAFSLFLIGLKFPSFFYSLYLNGMFLLDFVGKGLFSGFRTAGTIVLATLGTIIFKSKNQSNELKREFDSSIVALFLLGVYLSLSLLWTQADEYGLFKVQGFWLGVFIPFFVFFEFLRKDIKKLNVISKASIIFSITAVTIILIENGGFSIGSRVTIDGVNTIWYGRYIGAGLIFSYYYCFHSKKTAIKRFRIMWFITSIYLLMGLLMNGSRGPLLAAVLAIIIMEFFIFKTSNMLVRFLKNIFLTFLSLFCIILLILFVPRLNPQHFFQDQNVIERIEFINMSITGFLEEPLIGWGIGGYSTLLNENNVRIYPHNIILEFGVELGIIGLCFIAYIVYSFFKNRKILFVNDEGKVWSTLFIFYFTCALFSGDLFGNAAIWLPGAAMIQIKRYNSKSYKICNLNDSNANHSNLEAS